VSLAAEETTAQRAWTEQLEQRGSVEFVRSRGTLVKFLMITSVFVVTGVLMAATSSSAYDRSIGVLCIVFFGIGLVVLIRTAVSVSTLLTVDHDGLRVSRRRPCDIPWGSVVELGTAKVNRLADTQLLIRTTPEFYADYLSRLPVWLRTLLSSNQRTMRRNCLIVQFLAVPAAELAAWLDEQVDRWAPVVRHLVLMPEDVASPLFSADTLRPVALEKLRLSSDLDAALRGFADRAAPVAEQIGEGGAPGATWGYLAGEGRELSARVQRELGAGASVVWFEDGSPALDAVED
jgi:hypothetical protein